MLASAFVDLIMNASPLFLSMPPINPINILQNAMIMGHERIAVLQLHL
jgi:hypothetical protein